jgi:L-ribulose-5-phosphate 3-epimerase
MRLAYNTNGLAHHDLIDAITVLAEIGYRGVAITLDHGALNPFDSRLDEQLSRVAATLAKHEFRCVIETGARFLLDPQVKHEPTLVSADPFDRARRTEFLCRAIDIGAALEADCVSLWSGIIRDGAGDGEAYARLTGGLQEVLAYAADKQMPLAFEPEPGMFIDTLARFADLLNVLDYARIDSSQLRLTADIGHLHCQGELPIAEQIRRWAPLLANVHIEDMRSGVHEHMMFGEGEIDFRPVIARLAEIGYAGLLGVELSRHSHLGPAAARQAYNYLWPLVESAGGA